MILNLWKITCSDQQIWTLFSLFMCQTAYTVHHNRRTLVPSIISYESFRTPLFCHQQNIYLYLMPIQGKHLVRPDNTISSRYTRHKKLPIRTPLNPLMSLRNVDRSLCVKHMVHGSDPNIQNNAQQSPHPTNTC